PKINIEKTSTKTPQESFQAIKTMLSYDPDLRKLDSSYKCEFDETSLSGKAKGEKFEAKLLVAGGRIQLEVQIPLMLTPFKGMIETTLTKKLEKALS
ncbi:MAG: polyhydroxyalkanoic acid system family protein, partial [Bdellovibrionales bacterium]|nr:polyhydroxyalkanoic acid system family protein [Bdellovibrionales bacterium]